MTRLTPTCTFPAAFFLRTPALLSDFILALPILVFSLVAHEYAHGFAAYRQGDDTAYMLGRLTLNPLPHIDPIMSLLLPALLWFGSAGRFTFGGARPVPVNPRKYRHYKRGDIIVSSAGVVTNLVISVVCAALFVAIGLLAQVAPSAVPALDAAQRMMVWGIWLNLMLCFFNLIPIPPLDGSHLFYYLLPPAWGDRYRSLQRFGFIPLMALMLLFPAALSFLLTPAYWGMGLLLNLVHPYAVGDGWNIFSR
ncbi:MAG: site-2 protease family protein [Gemmatimonadota bacterium]